LTLRKRKKLAGARSNKYGGCRMTRICLAAIQSVFTTVCTGCPGECSTIFFKVTILVQSGMNHFNLCAMGWSEFPNSHPLVTLHCSGDICDESRIPYSPLCIEVPLVRSLQELVTTLSYLPLHLDQLQLLLERGITMSLRPSWQFPES
jgi:hypothetical protein